MSTGTPVARGLATMHPVFRLRQPKTGAPPPDRLSFSALREIDLCPRRWWLLHSQYDGLLGPYPELVFAATVRGAVVHGALKAFGGVLRRAGDPAPGSVDFVEMRRAFPLRETVRQLRREALNHLANNPRVDVVALSAAVSVDGCIAAFKRLVTQAYSRHVMGHSEAEVLASMGDAAVCQGEARVVTCSSWERRFPQGCGHEPSASGETNGPPAAGPDRWSHPDAVPCPAVLPEVQVEIADPPLRGTIDLVVTDQEGDTVVELKTGEPRAEHECQSRIYAVLWWCSTGRPIRRRLLVYADHEPVPLSGLGTDELRLETALLRERAATARANLRHHPPPARPTAHKCLLCPVRQMCEDYWQSPTTIENRWTIESLASLRDGEMATGLRDLELDLNEAEELQNGFSVQVAVPSGVRRNGEMCICFLCKVPPKFHPGMLRTVSRARLLRVGLRRQGSLVRAVWSHHSEVFWG